MVVACVERADSLAGCIDSIRASCGAIEVEIVAVVAGDIVEKSSFVTDHPGVRLISLPSSALVPQLWSEGIVASRGQVVAITLCQCSATKEWANAILSAIKAGASAAGGPIVLRASASMLDSAVFFLRYSAFMSETSMAHATTVEVAGDNAAYSRHALGQGGWIRESGFWEVDVHQVLRRRGDSIAWVPAAKMEFANAGSLSAISHHRYEHGKLFGQSRHIARGESVFRIALASPVVPFVLMTRAARRAWPFKEYRTKLLGSLPAFAWLAGCWALGEAVGAVEAGIANRR